jgi:NAD(P)-dependent dehydrogenase (short-subunit alcohol dehydrogenase family)
MDLGVTDRRFLVVGGTAGMGLAAARVLLADGARVAIAGRDHVRAAAAAEVLRTNAAGEVAVVTGDASTEPGAESIVDGAVRALGGLDGVAVTAGGDRSAHTDPEHATEEVWAAAFQGVLMATVRTVKLAVPHLMASGGGTVVTTAAYSIRAFHPARLPYITFKSGVATFTKTMAIAYGPAGIRANCVCPGAFETGGLSALRQRLAEERGIPPEGILEQMMADEWHMDVALRRLGQPEEAGDLIAFLLSRRADYLTGAVINIDGGTSF